MYTRRLKGSRTDVCLLYLPKQWWQVNLDHHHQIPLQRNQTKSWHCSSLKAVLGYLLRGVSWNHSILLCRNLTLSVNNSYSRGRLELKNEGAVGSNKELHLPVFHTGKKPT
jgi:hypothetical protein